MVSTLPDPTPPTAAESTGSAPDAGGAAAAGARPLRREPGERRPELQLHLERVASGLSSASTEAAVLRVVLDEGVAALGLTNAAFWRAEGGELVLGGAVGYREESLRMWARVPASSESPVARVLRSGAPVWLGSRAAYAREYPGAERQSRPAGAPPVSFGCLPLLVEERVTGVVAFGFGHEHPTDEEERGFLALLAAQCAQALERTRLLDLGHSASETFGAVFRASPAAIILLDLDGTVRLWNPAAERIFGWSAAEVLGQVMPQTPEAEPFAFLEQLAAVGRGEEIAGLEVRRLRRGGSFDAAIWAAPVHHGDGRVQCLTVVADISERKRIEQMQRYLNDAGRLLAGSLDYEQTLERVVNLTVPAYADWCFVDLLDREGASFERVAVGQRGERGAAIALTLKTRYPLRPELGRGITPAIREQKTQLITDITDDETYALMRASARDGAHFEAMKAVGARSYVIAPLVARGAAIGALTLAACDRNFDQRDVWLAEELSRSAAAAIDNARLFRAESRARARIGRMQEVTAALSRARTGREVAEVACRIGAEAMGARSGAMWVKGPQGPLNLTGSWGLPSPLLDTFRVIPLDHPDAPAARAARTGAPEWIESDEEFRASTPRLHADARRAGRTAAFGVVPLRIGAETAGVLVFAHDPPHRYDEDDRGFFVTLGMHAAQALERARLLDAELRANDRLSLLVRAGETFSDRVDYEATLESVVTIALPALGDIGFFDVVEGARVRRFADAHEDREAAMYFKRSSWEAAAPGPLNLCALSSGESGFHPDIDDAWMQAAARSPEHLAGMRRRGLCSLITVPLSSRGATTGALTLLFARSGRRHTREDLALAEELARRAAAAIEQARLYREAQEAARMADEANRLKDEFLATVSHELRTPLNAISGWAALLEERPNMDPSVARGVAVIRRNALAQARLIDDILDVSRIITGKLRLDPRPVDLCAIVRDAIDVVRPSADARRIEVALEVTPEPCLLVGDPDRLQQVVWNLLSNSVKFSGDGGQIAVRVAPRGPSLELTVADRGRGIAPEFLPHVFERFKQADGSTTRTFGGLGLGLAIVRHIVELHGGRASAESAGLGHGALFRVTLPVRAAVSPAAADRESAPPGSAPEASIGRALGGVRVLVVDDEADARELLDAVLSARGATVLTSPSVAAALGALPRFRPDVVVSDIGMPGEDGLALITRIRALPRSQGGAVPAVAVTAYARAEDRRFALSAGFDRHVPKPIDPAELLSVIAGLLPPRP